MKARDAGPGKTTALGQAALKQTRTGALAERVDVRCFKSDPGIKSSLTFLRKTPWARAKVEALFVELRRRQGD